MIIQSQSNSTNNLLSGYTTGLPFMDEMWGEQGNLRPHWQAFIEKMQAMGGEELGQRQQEVLRLLRENGVTYSVYDDPQGLNRPWKLDPVPMLIEKADWQITEAGLKQRAELLNLILTDIYGERKLIKKGLLPLELVYNHSGFLRACDQVRLPGKYQLFLYAADLARGPDGRMWVISDRTQAPSGTGYALENRSAMTRVFPDLFQNIPVRKLAHFFQALRNGLMSLSAKQPEGGRKENPRIVVLTPGPHNETYFEHAYLASYLGYALVQGDDLMVRDGYVWLKTLGGLETVDIIIRRVDDEFCDPLELRKDSQLGVAGLLEVMRRGNVLVVNPLGSGVLENPALMAFLPSISRHLLNEELILPSVATWWCGQPKEKQYVLDNLENLIIKTLDRQHKSTQVGQWLDKKQLADLRFAIQSRPHLYIGQEHVSFSTAPSFINGHLEPMNTVLRTFLVAQNDHYAVMPGGLTRSSSEKGNFLLVSNQKGGISKDTWIIGAEAEPIVSSLNKPANYSRTSASNTDQKGVLPSRTAENLFWVGRYTERALSTARLLRTVLRNLNESNSIAQEPDAICQQTLLKALTQLTRTYPGFVDKGSQAKLQKPLPEVLSIILDTSRPGSLSYTLKSLFRSVYAVRDRWSMDSWRVIDTLEKEWQTLETKQQADHPETTLRHVQNALDHLITTLVAFMGLNTETLSREQGWLLLDAGRRIELSLALISMVRSTLVVLQEAPAEYALQEAILTSNESLITYRFQYRTYLELQTVLDLLLMDTTYPRSLAYQLAQLQNHLSAFPRKQSNQRLSPEEKLIMEAFTTLRLAEVSQLVKIEEDATIREDLDSFLAAMSRLLSKTSEVITLTFFNHAQGQQQLTLVTPYPEL
jgi:uncharacterized circularly permuted ATP-grasp superfamily protein/uncharacterized alpha-E superfamily protein